MLKGETMSLFKSKPKPDDAEKSVDLDVEREIARRQFCIQQATYVDETRPESLIALAEKIYEYIWGPRA
jgi:hypothetical protein